MSRTGRPHKLTAEQEDAVYLRITSTPRRRRCFAYFDMARTFGVGVSTLQRIVTLRRRKQLSAIADTFHENLKSKTTSPSGEHA